MISAIKIPTSGLAFPSTSAVCCSGDSVINVYINYEKKFAFVEFRTGALCALCTLAERCVRCVLLPLHSACPHTQLTWCSKVPHIVDFAALAGAQAEKCVAHAQL